MLVGPLTFLASLLRMLSFFVKLFISRHDQIKPFFIKNPLFVTKCAYNFAYEIFAPIFWLSWYSWRRKNVDSFMFYTVNYFSFFKRSFSCLSEVRMSIVLWLSYSLHFSDIDYKNEKVQCYKQSIKIIKSENVNTYCQCYLVWPSYLLIRGCCHPCFTCILLCFSQYYFWTKNLLHNIIIYAWLTQK